MTAARKPAHASFLGRFLLVVIAASVPLPPQPSDALRMINLDAPESALQGDTIRLGCFFSLGSRLSPSSSPFQEAPGHHSQITRAGSLVTGGRSKLADDEPAPDASSAGAHATSTDELVYAIKWYKDEREFFRFLARDWPHKQALALDGIQVDVPKSDNHTVVLANVSLKTSGLFRCEVSTEAPSFVTESIERRLLVFSLPESGPQIESANRPRAGAAPRAALRHSAGESVQLACNSAASKPGAQIDWIINDWLNISSLTSESPFRVSELTRQPARLGGNRTALEHEREARFGGSSSQLPEMTSSQLNFTIDSNLFRLLAARQPAETSASPRHQQQQQRPHRPRPRRARQPGLAQSVGLAGPSTPRSRLGVRDAPARPASEVSSGPLISRPVSRALDGPPKPRAVVSEAASRASENRINAPRKSSFVSTTSAAAHSQAARHAAKTPTQGGQFFAMRDGHKSLIKVKCVARVLHLSMSDEIRIRIVDKLAGGPPRTSGSLFETHARQAQRNSHPATHPQNSTIMLVISALITFFLLINRVPR